MLIEVSENQSCYILPLRLLDLMVASDEDANVSLLIFKIQIKCI